MAITWEQLGDEWLVKDPTMALGWQVDELGDNSNAQHLRDYLHMQMAVAGLRLPSQAGHAEMWSGSLLANLQEKNRLLGQYRPPVDQRLERFLRGHFGDAPVDEPLHLPYPSLVLDRHGMARLLSLPSDGDRFENELLTSTRVINGVVHNPRADRRTTKGTFHVCEGGLPIPADKLAVPKGVFGRLFHKALHPPEDMLVLPYTCNSAAPAKTFVSLLIRPLVCPAVENFCRHKSMEIRFFAPGGLVSNLDFVESIFGNAGDPLLPENDAGLDVLYWSGHSGCVILAPHLTQLTKVELGLLPWDDATERQRADGMCWRDPKEKYNDGNAFKATCRTSDGVMITLIADNYFGYCKKEVKTQISFAANLMGNVEEEHAGGALAFQSFSLGDEFQLDSQRYNGRTFEDVAKDYAEFVDARPEGYGVDRFCERLIYVPENAKASLYDQQIRWTRDGQTQSLRLEPGKVYMAPSGYKLQMEKHPAAPSWRLVGTAGEGIVCHKPCTVSGGGKSEISKSIRDYMLSGPIFVTDIQKDFDQLDELFQKDYSTRWRSDSKERPDYTSRTSRPLLDPHRTLGSVIKLLTPSNEYTPEYNAWLASIPGSIYAMAFIIKRFSKPEWQGDWRAHFSVDIINGQSGHELKYHNRKLVGMYLRVGLDHQRRWRTYKLRQDFAAAAKIQMEDDITASVVVPGRFLKGHPSANDQLSYKFVANCEYRLFQRPDDAIHRGLDKQTEGDVAKPNNFFCNFEPLDREAAEKIVADVLNFDKFTEPMQQLIKNFLETDANYVASSAHPRLVDGAPSKNPRYLQDRLDLSEPDKRYVALRGMRLFRALPASAPVYQPVAAVLSGRRNNPPDREAGIRSLAVYNPIHYQELPELFMDYICSLTGKSPSTTGAGSEGALTKGPFNALLPIHDLNAAFVSMVVTGLDGFSTAAGYVGSEMEFEHDISFLVPELWCRLTPAEKNPRTLIEEGMLEKVKDFPYQGRTILASRLGYRITDAFVHQYFGRLFDNPDKVFDSRILCPEEQDLQGYAEGIDAIVEAQKRVASAYFQDGSYEAAVPPLKILLSVMAHGHFDNQSIDALELRQEFERERILASAWYRERLETKRRSDQRLWQRHIKYLENYRAKQSHADVIARLKLEQRLKECRQRLEFCNSDAYLQRIQGTLGVDPALCK